MQYAEINDSKNTMKVPEESCKYAIIEASLKDMNYITPKVNRMKYRNSDISKKYKGNACNLRLKTLEDKRIDFVRNKKVFKRSISNLEKYVE